jgi:uncharacterized membrane protein HdeD (DUF308 family)
MIVGIHNFVDACGRYKDEMSSSDGGLWILAMDGLLLIPLFMAAFFYPIFALEVLAVIVVLSLISTWSLCVLVRSYNRRGLHFTHRHTERR